MDSQISHSDSESAQCRQRRGLPYVHLDAFFFSRKPPSLLGPALITRRAQFYVPFFSRPRSEGWPHDGRTFFY